MTSLTVRVGRISAMALVSLGVAAQPFAAVWAQDFGATAFADGPVERLGRYIRILAASPRDLNALLGAGQAALDVGDANAALGFFARAEEVAPSEGRAKAGLGASLVSIERPDDALRLFGEAIALGIPEVAIARDRGLAYDLRGDSRRAQRDYALAMTRRGTGGRDDELVRRYALSLGVSGDRAGAMALLDPLLRKQDQGAWRARSFIMAMTGDVAGANTVAQQLMVPAMANAMSPLLTRLASLNAAERAHAVHFGTVPADGTRLAVQTGDPYATTSVRAPQRSLVALPPVGTTGSALIPAGEPLGPRRVEGASTSAALVDARRQPSRAARLAPALSTRRSMPSEPVRPGFSANVVSALPRALPEPVAATLSETRVATVAMSIPDAATDTPLPSPMATPPSVMVVTQPSPPVAAAAPTRVLPVVPPAATIERAALPPASVPLPTLAPTPTPTPAPMPTLTPTPTPTVAPTASASRLAGLLNGITPETETTVELPSVRELRVARQAARRKTAELAAQTAAEELAKREKAEKAALAKRNPPRIWVQVATGRNDSGLGISWRRIRDGNAAAFKGQSAWSAEFRATNRILVGPMRSTAAARDLVNRLAKGNLATTIYTSDAGEEVVKIASQ